MITDIPPGVDERKRFAAVEGLKGTGRVEVFLYSEAIDVRTEVALRKLKIGSYYLTDGGIDAVVEGVALHFNPIPEENYDEWKESMYAAEVQEPVAYDSVVTADEFELETAARKQERSAAPAAEEFESFFDDLKAGFEKALDKEGIGGPEAPCAPRLPTFAEGVGMFREGRYPEAEEVFVRFSSDPEHTDEALLMLGRTRVKLRKVAKAVAVFQQGFKGAGNPDKRKEFAYDLGVLLQALGKAKEAFQFLGAIYKTDPGYKDVRQRLAALKPAAQG